MKPTLYEPQGKNRYCGPTAVAAITGVTTDEAARLMREHSGRRAIRGAGLGEVWAALRARGCQIIAPRAGVQYAGLKASERPTIASWLRSQQLPTNRHVVVVFRHHYGVILGRRYICAQSRGVVPLSGIPGRRGRVHGWFEVALPESAPPLARPVSAVISDGKAAAMSKARRLAKAHGIELEREREREGYWVTHPKFDDGDDDPRQGEHFCVGGYEVLEAVEAYVEALEKEDATA